jgi:hypothetical protein
LYSSGVEAAAAAAAFSDVTGDKCQPRPFKLDEDWMIREQLRLINGTYQPLPWDRLAHNCVAEYFSEQMPQDYMRIEHYHDASYQYRHNWFYSRRKQDAKFNFPHISKSKRGNIAFTESADRGKRNIKTSSKPGRYLQRFYDLPRDTVQLYARDFTAQFGEVQLRFASTIEELDMLFAKDFGPNSCMTYELHCYVNKYPPTRVYANSDLQVAYIALTDEDDNVYRATARCVVWPEKKLFGRIYGDDSYLGKMLREQGYKHGYFAGAKLPKIPVDGRPDEWHMPYLDGHCDVKDNGDHWVICKETAGDVTAQSTSGTICCNGNYCECCEGPIRRNYATYITDADQTWCRSCRDEHAFYCERCTNWYSDDTENHKIMPEEEDWCERCIEAFAGFCDATETYWRQRDLIVMEENGELWNADYFKQNGKHCPYCQLNLAEDAVCEKPDTCDRFETPF